MTNGTRLDPVAGTALITAAQRARESARADALFHDPSAATLAGETGASLLAAAGDIPAIAVRTRFFDDAVRDAVGYGGPHRLVIVAAGMDTRAFRLGLPEEVTVYELDRPELLARKEGVLVDSEPTCHRVTVGVDLAADDWEETLTAAGFRAEDPTCWLVEGLNQYLPESAVHALFGRLSALSAPGSRLLTDFVSGALLAAPEARPVLDLMAEWGADWRFGTDAPQELLERFGWDTEVQSFAAVGSALGRPMPGGDALSGWLVSGRR
ncbi:SAM-dependent methyltransferase [Streptomyces sp. SCA3-4]|uniref:class I SAM-dependent methyltransferase n=1 Tax=Streptomyces sichuanensis TaxID=2871810 RepID=UPI001CE2EB2F|nr:SAM-dependent methyltransferase [Streptomyces sichuanensis]MCA6093003.1 SAM-dependent methyltransferase [Streptomyces sichuanensis]